MASLASVIPQNTLIPSQSPAQSIGVLGGGQLGRMMAAAAHRLGLGLIPLDPLGAASSAGQVASTAMTGPYLKADATQVKTLAVATDVLTVEIEHVDTTLLHSLATSDAVLIHPSPETLAMIQDKWRQKTFCQAHAIPVAPCCLVSTLAEAAMAGQTLGYPYMLKARTLAYDGKGNAVVTSPADEAEAFARLGGLHGMLYAEQFIDLKCELAMMIVKGRDGSLATYPLVQTTQVDSVCTSVLVPATVPETITIAATALATKAVAALTGAGIYGVELFLDHSQQVLLNEIAPRPHNSGHYTIEACETDQFENHLRAVAGLPLGSCVLKTTCAMMINVFGTGDPVSTHAPLQAALAIPGAGVHHYNKPGGVAVGRKVGHITLTAMSLRQLRARVTALETLTQPRTSYMIPYPQLLTPPTSVGIVMGSDSDLPTMQHAATILKMFDIACEVTIVSAHRTPERLVTYATEAHARGLKVIIAGAGGAAHLPGMLAALTPLPVIGVPIKSACLNGVDSLLSIVQMPRGVPVATVAIGNATNAGLLAVRLLAVAATSFPGLMTRMRDYMQQQKQEVETKAARLEAVGTDVYLKEMAKLL